MEKLNLKLKRTSDTGIFHDSRADSRLIIKCVNTIVSKLNEVIEENNELKKEISNIKKYDTERKSI
jgi:hypothetical protein